MSYERLSGLRANIMKTWLLPIIATVAVSVFAPYASAAPFTLDHEVRKGNRLTVPLSGTNPVQDTAGNINLYMLGSPGALVGAHRRDMELH